MAQGYLFGLERTGMGEGFGHKGAYGGVTQISGLTHAIRKFQKIARAYDGKGFKELEDALYEGALMIQASARSRIGIKTGKLWRSVAAKRFGRKIPNAPAVFVAIDIKIGKGSGMAAHLVEYGTVERFTESGASRGMMPAKPFMRPAVDENRYNVIAKVRNRMSKIVKVAAIG